MATAMAANLIFDSLLKGLNVHDSLFLLLPPEISNTTSLVES